MKIITLIIPIHNRIEITKIGLNSIYSSLNYYYKYEINDTNYEIVVVDDGSTDGSSAWIKQNYPKIHLLLGDGNLWWTGAVNLGAKYAIDILKANYILLWNDDTKCSVDYFVRLNEIIAQKKYTDSILVSKIYWQDEPNILFNFGCKFNKYTGEKQIIGLNEIDNERYNAIINVDWSGGMGTLIPAKIVTELNFFNANYFPQYHGDIDFCLRAIETNHQIYAIPSLLIWNNRESSGISKVQSWSDLKLILTSFRSFYNFKQNYKFNKIHSNTAYSWLLFSLFYSKFIAKSFIKIILK